MATKIADLYANLSLKSTLNKDVKQANGQMGKLSSTMGRTTSQSGGMAASMGMAGGAAARLSAVALPLAAGLTAAGAATYKLVTDAGNMADKMLDLHERTGLALDTLQEYQHVTSQAGVEYDQFTKGIEVFNRKLIESEQGTGRTVDVLKELGVEVYGANGQMRSMEDMLPELQSSLAGMEDTTKRNAYASQLFGRNTEAMLPILAMGEEGIRKAKEEAHEMGMVLSEENINASNKFRQSTEKLKEQMQALGTRVAVDLIPVLNKYLIPAINDYLIPGFKVAAKVIKVSLTPAIAGLKAAFSAIEPIIEPLQKALIRLYNTWADMINRLRPVLNALGYDFEKLEHISMDSFKSTEDAAKQTAKGTQQAADQYAAAMEQMAQASDDAKPSIEEARAARHKEILATQGGYFSGDGEYVSAKELGVKATNPKSTNIKPGSTRSKSSEIKSTTNAVNSMKSADSSFRSRLMNQLNTINKSINNLEIIVNVNGAGGGGGFSSSTPSEREVKDNENIRGFAGMTGYRTTITGI
jgi:hypothetical protein